jgi:hypothetical protein
MPIFQRTISSNRDIRARTVSIAFEADDSKKYEVHFDIKCVPTAIFALTNEQGIVLSTLPQGERPAAQTIKGTGILPALNSAGMPALILQLEGGGELTIEYSKQAITEVAKHLAELVMAMNRGNYH